MEHEYFAHHIKEDDSGFEHLIASMQPEVLGRSVEALDGALEVLEDDSEVLAPAVLGYEELGGCAPMNNRHGFYGSPTSQARGLDTAKLLDADSCEDWRPENFYTMCHDFWILNSKSWNLDSRLGGCGIRVIDGLFFKFLEDISKKIED